MRLARLRFLRFLRREGRPTRMHAIKSTPETSEIARPEPKWFEWK
jgi:hypothetical protein